MSNRQNTFLLKRSNVPGKIPLPGDLKLGEIALNTSDVILYASGTTTNTILPIGWDRISRTGDTVTGDFIFNGGITATTISATTYLNYPTVGGGGNYLPLSGGTVTGDTIFTSGLTVNTVDFNTTATTINSIGRLRWNNTDGTLDLGLKGGNVTLQIGQETVIRVVNKTSSNLLESQYKVVRIRTQVEGGGAGQRLAIKLAQADTKANHSGILGVVTEDINNNQEGFITSFGNINKINTTGSLQGETWLDGDDLWLSDTVAGGLTNVEPITHPVRIGYVLYAHAVNGKIFISSENGVDELDELHDVRIISPSNNDRLVYNSSTSVWENKPVASGTTGTVISFDSSKIYNTRTSPATGNITGDYTNARIGIVQKIYHNDSVTPTFPGTWVKLGSGVYLPSNLNIIYVEWTGSNVAEYWISKTI